jgi:transcriptional regulator with PAS, ATPase and Fis domain
MTTKHRTGTSSSYGTVEGAVSPTAETVSLPGLVLLYAPNFEQFQPAYVFNAPGLIIGRDAANPVCVPEQAVSRQHARIAFNGKRWILTDLGSRNGTMVDGQFITSEVELEHLHEIRVGDAVFKFVESASEKYTPYRLDGVVAGERKAKHINQLVGGCQMDHIASELERIAPTQLSCVILGETGTGKEVAARELHRVSARRGSFQAINCAAIPHNLLESELFGYRRGAFSGADRDKPGLIKLAHDGTLFLDEIGDMPLDAQAKLLRVLQSREVFPLGATTPEFVDIRVVCATHRDLYQFVKEGKFRGDLFARLNEHVVKLPPLRERKEDIFQLARLFAARYGRPNLSFLVALLHHDWPFNVRELESCIKRGVALAEGDLLDTPQLPDQIQDLMKSYGVRPRHDAPSLFPSNQGSGSGSAYVAPQAHSASYPPLPVAPPAPTPKRAPPTESELRELLGRHRGNVAAVGRELGKERMQVHRWMKRYGISIDEYREER